MRRPMLTLLVAALALGAGACAKKHPTAPVAVVPQGPAPDSPANVVKSFAWAWQNRNSSAYMPLLTNDFTFLFAANDSAGSPWPDRTWGLVTEAAAVRAMFAGNDSRPPASDVRLWTDNVLVAFSDPRPGKNPKWHRSVRTHVQLEVTFDQNGTPDLLTVQGYALFYVVRGDSAVLSRDRLRAGGADSTRWYIERWEDETAGANGSAAAVLPTRSLTWGYVKGLYAPPPALAR